MRSAIGVCLIVFGTVIVSLPAISDLARNYFAMQLMSPEGFHNISIGGTMSAEYRFGCWILGACMIATSAIVWISALRYELKNARKASTQPWSNAAIR